MRITTPLSSVPLALRGLWKFQYAPIEEAFQVAVNSPDMNECGRENGRLYKKATIAMKMCFLDKLHANYVNERTSII